MFNTMGEHRCCYYYNRFIHVDSFLENELGVAEAKDLRHLSAANLLCIVPLLKRGAADAFKAALHLDEELNMLGRQAMWVK